MFTQISAGSRRRTSTMRSVPDRSCFGVITAGMPLFSQNAKTSSASVATSSRSRRLARRARSYPQASIGRPQIARSTLRGRRRESSRAGITPRTLPMAPKIYRQAGRNAGRRAFRRLAKRFSRGYTPRSMRQGARLPVGKLPPRLLESLLASCPIPKSSRVVLGPRLGKDAAVIDWGSRYLVAKTDPITFTAERLGWYAVNINANDVATLGARPRWFLATLLLPERRATPALVRRIFRDTLRACRALGVTLCGGHTEVTAGLDRPVLVGQMLGEVEKSRLVRKESQQPGDLVILTKGVAIEGTSILAREKAGALRRKLGDALLRRARRLLFSPGISVVREARLAATSGGVRAMHDPTEGGLLAGLYELARAGRVGLRVQKENVPVLKETLAFARVLGFDPLALIASGALLVVAAPAPTPPVHLTFQARKIPAGMHAEGSPEKDGIASILHGQVSPIMASPPDQQ